MEYTVQKLSKLAGVSPRTLRYYDEIGLLKPARVSSSGYRIYGSAQVDALQQILFYRELGVDLETVKRLMEAPMFDGTEALRQHRAKLLERRAQLDALIDTVEKTIAQAEGSDTMSDAEKFEGFKQKLIDENEAKYGREIREKYGEAAVNASHAKVKGMSAEQYSELEKLSKEIMDTLYDAYQTGNPASDLAQKAVALHREWLSFYWDSYTPEAHAGIAQMYVEDPRFTAYYDAKQPGLAVFLRDAVLVYTGRIINR